MDYDALLTKYTRSCDFARPRDLLAAAVEYFNWCSDNPLQEERLFNFKGMVTRADAAKMRAMSKGALATYIGVTVSKLEEMRTRGEDWSDVVEFIEQVIYAQKFEGAAAGMLNATLISRDLGLAERTETDLTGTLETSSSVADTILDRIARIADARGAGAGASGSDDQPA